MRFKILYFTLITTVTLGAVSHASRCDALKKLTEYSKKTPALVAEQRKNQLDRFITNRGTEGSGREGSTQFESTFKELVRADSMLSIKPGETLVDFGSGLGIPGLFFGSQHPELTVRGYEIVPEKISASKAMAKELGLENLTFSEQDLAKPFAFPEADYYYFFNPVNEPIFKNLLQQIREVAKRRSVKIIAVHKPNLDNVPWLKNINANSKLSRLSGEMSVKIYQSTEPQKTTKSVSSVPDKVFKRVLPKFLKSNYSDVAPILRKFRPDEKLAETNLNNANETEVFQFVVEQMLKSIPEARREKFKRLVMNPTRHRSSSNENSFDGMRINTAVPKAYENTFIDYQVRIHELAHAIQNELEGENSFLGNLRRMFKWKRTSFMPKLDLLRQFSLRERGAMEWEWLYGHLNNPSIREAQANKTREDESLGDNWKFFSRNLKQFEKTKSEFLADEAPERGYSVRKMGQEGLDQFYMDRVLGLMATSFASLPTVLFGSYLIKLGYLMAAGLSP